ncbi:hypothetical protein [Xanthocytophaga flava]|nr:hypothetical protein [Xanthocytophaga flavus]
MSHTTLLSRYNRIPFINRLCWKNEPPTTTVLQKKASSPIQEDEAQKDK